MFSTKLFPDFNKLKSYFPAITNQMISDIEANVGVPVNLEHYDEYSFIELSNGLKTVLTKYNLDDHYSELLYLVVKKDEEIRITYNSLWQNYNDDKTSKEIAEFLLAYKQSKPNQPFQLTAKAFTGSVSIKNTHIARWMCEIIYTAIEKQEFPLRLFGAKVLHNLFGSNPFDVNEVSIETLEATAKLTTRKPTVKLKRLYVEFCLYVQLYLINQTHLTLPENVLFTDTHTNLFFDLLELLGYLDRDEIESEPKDYIHTMLRNQIR
jgi:hypothetical protein